MCSLRQDFGKCKRGSDLRRFVNQRETEREESVQVLRGIAAFSVMWFHLTNGNGSFLPTDSLLKWSGAYGYLGVQLFFVISGFIIPYSLSHRSYRLNTDGLSFLCRRIVRIEPAYLVSALLMAILQVASALTPGSNALMPASGLGISLILHLAYLAPWFDVAWLSPVYWSLAIEFQYYIAMLFFVSFLLSRRRAAIYLFLLSTALLPLLFFDERTLFHFLPLFGLGFIRFLAYRRLLTRAELSSWAVVFLSLCWFVLDSLQAFAAAFAFGFLFLPLRRPVPILSFLGAISFSLYLIHIPLGGRVINLAVRLPLPPALQFAAVVLASLISMVGAFCFWCLIENPSAKLSKSIGSLRQASPGSNQPALRSTYLREP
jgi:peptidoglycan/LPS O-acetylase OafA/YrhL